MAGGLELAVSAEAEADARKRQPVGVVDVPAGRSHGDSSGALGHAEPARKVDALLFEKPEDSRIQVTGGGQAPAEPLADNRADDALPVGAGGLVQLFQAPLVELGPADGDADESRRIDLGEEGEQRVGRGIPGEDVCPPPEDHAEKLQVTAERVKEGKKAQEDLVVADVGQGRRPGEALGDQVVGRKGHAFRPPGRARGEHDRGDFVDRPAAAGLEKRFEGTNRPAFGIFNEDAVLFIFRLPGRGHGQDPERPGRPAADFAQDFPAVRPVGEGDRDVQSVEDLDQVVDVEMGIDRRVQNVVKEAGQIGRGAFDVVFRVDRHPGLRSVLLAHGVE